MVKFSGYNELKKQVDIILEAVVNKGVQQVGGDTYSYDIALANQNLRKPKDQWSSAWGINGYPSNRTAIMESIMKHLTVGRPTTATNRSVAQYLCEVNVPDPDIEAEVTLCVYKDRISGGIFAIDLSYIDQVSTEVISPFNPNTILELQDE